MTTRRTGASQRDICLLRACVHEWPSGRANRPLAATDGATIGIGAGADAGRGRVSVAGWACYRYIEGGGGPVARSFLLPPLPSSLGLSCGSVVSLFYSVLRITYEVPPAVSGLFFFS
jgi:hypothetical protein